MVSWNRERRKYPALNSAFFLILLLILLFRLTI